MSDRGSGTLPKDVNVMLYYNINNSSRYAILRIMTTRELLSFLRLVLKPGLNF